MPDSTPSKSMPQLRSVSGLRSPRGRRTSTECPTHRYPNDLASRQLAKNYLSFRAAKNVVDDRVRAVKNTKSWIQWESVNGNYEYEEQLSYLDELATREKELEKCRKILKEGEFGIVYWSAKLETGKYLPGEILTIILDLV